MKAIIGTFICLLSLNVYSGDMDTFPQEISDKLDLKNLETNHLDNIELKAQAATIFTILVHTQELEIHQLNGAVENQVFLHKDGHKEAVYDGSGKLVNDCLNQGSYNYYHPYQYPLGHFTADILPWLIFGNCRNDPSTKEQRIKAYVSDLRLGFSQVIENNRGFYLPENFGFKEYGQSVAVSFYLKALSEASFDFKSFVPKHINNREQQELFFLALEKGFGILLKNA